MSPEARIRLEASRKVRVELTHARRSAHGYIIHCWDGTVQVTPTRKAALQIALAVVRCMPVRFVRVVRRRAPAPPRP